MIPTFPEFTPLTLEHKDAVDAVLAQHPPLASEYTFTNLFAWGGVNHYQLARFAEGLFIRKGCGRGLALLQPLGMADGAQAIVAGLEYLATASDQPLIDRVGEDFLAAIDGQLPDLTVEEDRANFDYVYDVEELIALAGDKYHAKKNLLNQFLKFNPARYLSFTPDIVARALRFQHAWCSERECEKDDGLRREQCAVFRMLQHFDALRIRGGAIEIGGELVALTLGERLNEDTLVIHVEKARAGITGLYQAINREFLRDAGQEFHYVNREQDLGVPGLRKAKLSYNPVRLIKKYRISR